MIEICRDHARNVKRWRDGQMALRWCAAGMLEAKKQFRRVNGHLHSAKRCAPRSKLQNVV
jgi:putative transposase